MTTKGDLVEQAYIRLKISGLTVKADPEDITMALFVMDAMAAEWEQGNVCTGYDIASGKDPNVASNVEAHAEWAFVTNLAVRLAPAFGKPTQDILLQAKQSFSRLSSAVALTRQVAYPRRMPRGSGNDLRYNRWQRYFKPQVEAPLDCSTNYIQLREINDYTESWDSYLEADESIATFDIFVFNGLKLLSASLASPLIHFRVEAESIPSLPAGFTSGVEGGTAVSLEVTTSSGRKDNRLVDFIVTEQQQVL